LAKGLALDFGAKVRSKILRRWETLLEDDKKEKEALLQDDESSRHP
jgi:hypothetical protein